MLKKIIEFLESVPMVIIGGVFLAASLILPNVGVNYPIYLDPAWVPFVVSGIPLAYSAVRKLVYNKGISKISSALLITVAMIAAICIKDIFAAGEIAFIMALGEILEDKTTEKAKKGLKKLIALAPITGRLITADGENIISAENIKVGDVLRVFPGETIPVDGVIISGDTSIDQSVITGESLPVDKAVGDEVFCGTVNRFGSIDIKAVKVGEDSSLKKLIRMVKDAEENKAPIQRIADKWASWLVPVALLLAVFAGVIRQDIVVAVTVLVVFCPCALVLATPTAIMAAIGQATKQGVIIKSGEALEKMGKVDLIAFDKTGTLTYGRPEVSDIIPAKQLTEAQALAIFAAAECKSEHPLGKAIVAKANEAGIEYSQPDSFGIKAGKGVFARIDGKQVFCGNEKFIAEQGVSINEEASKAITEFASQGKALVIGAVNGEVFGIIALSDVIKPEAEGITQQLSDMGADTLLLTGDNRFAAEYFAKQANIKSFKADLLPEEKVNNIVALQNSGKTVCMIGDGVNDAPALKSADVSVAMGTMGSDIAIEAADIALMGDDVSKIPYLKKLSNATARTIKISISASLLINFAAIILSFLKILNPTTGALVHNAGSLAVILFAALLYDRKFIK